MRDDFKDKTHVLEVASRILFSESPDLISTSGILTTYKSITIDRLTDYCKAYDEIYGRWCESEWEGNDVIEFILECEGLL